MAKLVTLITSQIDRGHDIGEAWQKAGAPRVTFIEGHGLRSLQEGSKSAEILPGTFSFQEIIRHSDSSSMLVISVVNDLETAKRLIETAQTILGDLTQPNTGIAFVIDLDYVLGYVER